MTKLSIGLVCMAITLSKVVFATNMLFIAPLASPSHYIWNKILAMALVEKGYNVTILTHDTEKKVTPNNYTVITLEGLYDVLYQYYNFEEAMEEHPMLGIKSLYDYVKFSCEYDLQTKGLETILNYPKDMFDLIIYDATMNQCLYPLIDIFNKPPVVAVTAFLFPPGITHALGSHVYTSYLPYYSTEFTNNMTFTERVINIIYTYTDLLYRNLLSTPAEYGLVKKRFGEHVRPLEEIERDIGLLLVNIDPNFYYPIPLPPNIIPIGGLHVKPAAPLPKEIGDILDNARHGVILFSLGTNIKFDMLSSSQKEALFAALSKFPQTVLWKIEANNPEKLPKNIISRKWLPQNDVLGHPNTKLFITHAGGLSTHETIYHGIPVVAIPFLIDQYMNAKIFVERKLGKSLDHKNLTAQNVFEAVKEVLENPVYHNNMQIASKRFRDQPQTALERAVFWIEFALRNKNVDHLSIPTRDMPFYKIENMDILLAFVVLLFCIYKLIKLMFTITLFALRCIFRRKPKKSKKD